MTAFRFAWKVDPAVDSRCSMNRQFTATGLMAIACFECSVSTYAGATTQPHLAMMLSTSRCRSVSRVIGPKCGAKPAGHPRHLPGVGNGAANEQAQLWRILRC
jgi:hypothetical protein